MPAAQQTYQAPPDKYSSKNAFIYTTQPGATLNAGNSTSSTFNIDGDSDFFWTKFTVYADVGNAGTDASTVVVPSVNIIITNTTTGRQYMNNAVSLAAMAGNGQLPFVLPMVTFWPSKATLQVSYTNISTATNYTTLQLNFIGYKAFLKG